MAEGWGWSMKVLVACEFSGIVREAFKAKGHDAWSCDLLPTEIPGQHIQGDVLSILNDGWDLMIAHPPCTYLTCASARYLNEQPNRRGLMVNASLFFKILWTADYYYNVKKICIENPLPLKAAQLPPYTQIIHPYYFGEPFLKRTCLWIKNLPLLNSADKILERPYPTGYCIKKNGRRYNYYYHQGKNSHERSRTFRGIANAMADQWG